jgi:hypothetical protein
MKEHEIRVEKTANIILNVIKTNPSATIEQLQGVLEKPPYSLTFSMAKVRRYTS